MFDMVHHIFTFCWRPALSLRSALISCVTSMDHFCPLQCGISASAYGYVPAEELCLAEHPYTGKTI